ncbi:MAG TPA: ABC transporter permease subunit [Dongiaceae bacterium]|nr:ABC transporter permease subunit [Dongiaceae bacterium]
MLPGPAAVGRALIREADSGALWLNLGMTVYRVAVAFLLAMAVGAGLGIFMGRSGLADRLLDAWLIIGLNLPALVVMVLCYVWFGLNDLAAILAVALNKIPLVATIMREEARSIDRSLIEVGRVFRLSRGRIFRRIYLPQLYPGLFASARAGLALIWKLVLVVELLGRPNGVGFEIRTLFNYFDIAGILAYAMAFIAIVLAIEWAVLIPLERRATAWRRR